MRLQTAAGLRGGAVAGILSGAPSTAHAVLTRRPVLATVEAAGSLVLPATAPRWALLAAAAPVHGALSLGWGVALASVLPCRHTAAWGAAAGLAIAALDLGTVGRLRPRIRALPTIPQVLDHVAFGAVVGAVVSASRRAPAGGTA